MSQQNKSTLQSAINTQIADNTTGAITAAIVRNNLINITDSLVFNTGSQAITGSLTVTGGITGSLQGTAATASYVTPGLYIPSILTFGGVLSQTVGEDGWVGAGRTTLFSHNIINVDRNYWLDLSIITSGYAPGAIIASALYASSNGTTLDTLLATYNFTSSANTKYHIERTFFTSNFNDTETGTTTYYIRGLAGNTNANSDRLISSYTGESQIGYYGVSAPVIQYPYMIFQVSCSVALSCALGPSTITYR